MLPALVFWPLRHCGSCRGHKPTTETTRAPTGAVYLSAERIQDLLSALAAEKADAALIAEVCLATGARWGEAEALQPRQVRNCLIHYSKTKSSKNRLMPISAELQARLVKALAFRPGCNLFRKLVEKIALALPDGQLTHVLRHTFASHYMMNGGDILTLQRVLATPPWP